jgi:hypothetical protein
MMISAGEGNYFYKIDRCSVAGSNHPDQAGAFSLTSAKGTVLKQIYASGST